MPEENGKKGLMVTQAYVIPPDVRDAIREAAWQQRRSMSDLVREIFKDYLAKQEAA